MYLRLFWPNTRCQVQVMDTGKKGGNKTSSVALIGDYAGDGGGPDYNRVVWQWL